VSWILWNSERALSNTIYLPQGAAYIALQMPLTNFSAAATCALQDYPQNSRIANSTPMNNMCAECDRMKTQASARERMVDELTAENQRSRTALRDLEAEVAALRVSANSERSAAAHSADLTRAECDSIRDRLEDVSRQITTYENSTRADMVETQAENQDLTARLRATNEQLSSMQKDSEDVRLRLVRLEDEATNLKGQLAYAEKERCTLKDQLSQQTQASDESQQRSSALLLLREQTIKELEENLKRTGGDLNVAQNRARNLQDRLDAAATEIEQYRADLLRLRKESERRDALNDELED